MTGEIRLGVIVPSVNIVVEAWYPQIVPDGVSVHFARMLKVFREKHPAASLLRRANNECVPERQTVSLNRCQSYRCGSAGQWQHIAKIVPPGNSDTHF